MPKNKRAAKLTVEHGLRDAAAAVLRSCLRAKTGESLLVIFDAFGHPIAHAFAEAASAMQLDDFCARLVPVSEQERCSKRGALPSPIGECISKSSSVVFAVTSLDSTTKFRVSVLKRAVAAGAKIVHMPGVESGLFLDTLRGLDFERIHRDAERLRATLSRAHRVQVRTETHSGRPKTLDLVLDPSRKAHYCGGLAQPGEIMNIPTGEVYVAPLEFRARGELVLNGSASFCVFGGGDEAVLRFEDGVLDLSQSSFADRPSSRLLKSTLVKCAAMKRGRRNIALGELGFGLNTNIAELTGRMISDEKAAGTVHVALGANTVFGGDLTADVHEDLVFCPIGVTLDGAALDTPWRSAVEN